MSDDRIEKECAGCGKPVFIDPELIQYEGQEVFHSECWLREQDDRDFDAAFDNRD